MSSYSITEGKKREGSIPVFGLKSVRYSVHNEYGDGYWQVWSIQRNILLKDIPECELVIYQADDTL